MSVDCIIEIPLDSKLKLEYDYENKRLRLDRILDNSFAYPCNYGYIPNTLADDGDCLDIIMPVSYKIPENTIVKVKIIGVLKMEDESGIDHKIIVLPVEKIDRNFTHINNITDLDLNLINKLEFFFRHYKDLCSDKHVELKGIGTREEALSIFDKTVLKYNTSHV